MARIDRRATSAGRCPFEMVIAMPQPHKGDRHPVMVRLERPLYHAVKTRVQRGEATSVAQWIADLVAIDTGHYDRVRDLFQWDALFRIP